MRVCIFDFETEFNDVIDLETIKIIEIGAIVYDTERDMPITMLSKLISVPESSINDKVTNLTGLRYEDIKRYGVEARSALNSLSVLFGSCDYVCGHNIASFDWPIYLAECSLHGLKPMLKPRIDTRTDIKYPANIKTRKLTHLCAEHNFAPIGAHLATLDCLSTMELLRRYDIKEVIARSLEASYLVSARVSFQDKDLAKERGFYWDGEEKEWRKLIKESDLKILEEEAPFHITKQEIEK